jgi:hypothetical protein
MNGRPLQAFEGAIVDGRASTVNRAFNNFLPQPTDSKDADQNSSTNGHRLVSSAHEVHAAFAQDAHLGRPDFPG